MKKMFQPIDLDTLNITEEKLKLLPLKELLRLYHFSGADIYEFKEKMEEAGITIDLDELTRKQ